MELLDNNPSSAHSDFPCDTMGRRNAVHCYDKNEFQENRQSVIGRNPQPMEASTVPQLNSQEVEGNKMPMSWALKVGGSFCYAMLLFSEVCVYRKLSSFFS